MPESLHAALHRIGALKFGEFTLKSGLVSPFYIDLRLLISDPRVLSLAANALAECTADLEYARIAAIPYAGLPLGVALSLQVGKPLIYARKERKTYGTASQIEGSYQAGERILLVDDVITRGDSKLEALQPLAEAGLIIEDIAVLLDRQSGGTEALTARGYRVHAALTLRGLIDALFTDEYISTAQHRLVLDWLENQK